MRQLLSMNLTANFLILVILLLRHFCGRILSRRCFVWLSMIVILRLLFPLQFDVFPSQIPTVTGIMKMFSEKESDPFQQLPNILGLQILPRIRAKQYRKVWTEILSPVQCHH